MVFWLNIFLISQIGKWYSLSDHGVGYLFSVYMAHHCVAKTSYTFSWSLGSVIVLCLHMKIELRSCANGVASFITIYEQRSDNIMLDTKYPRVYDNCKTLFDVLF